MSDNSNRRIIITGFMGSGKTSVARALAERLDARMIDLDYIISERERRSPRALIDEEGEALFREAERRALRVVLEMNRARIIALGGGAWTFEENRELVAAHDCLTVWLDAPFALCWQRIAASPGERPLARDHASAQKLYDERRSAYALTELHVEASTEKSVEELAREIAEAL